MLIQFKVQNFRSFKDEAIFSMVTAPIKERKKENTFAMDSKVSLLKTAVLYGANASGKSNLLYALKFMTEFMRKSHGNTEGTGSIDVERFKLSTENEKKPASFEIVFLYEGIRYRYGFAADEEKVYAEWLFYVPKKQEVPVFTREGQKFSLTRHFKSEERLVQEERVRPNALLLSVSAQWNGKMASTILEWLKKINCISGVAGSYRRVSLHMSEDKDGHDAILMFLQRADLGIEDFKLRETKVELHELPPGFRELMKEKKGQDSIVQVDVITAHKKYDHNSKEVGVEYFDLLQQESEGTKRFFELSGPLIDTLSQGKILFVDELDARLHPHLVKAVCELFNSAELNPNNAQLVFVSHNTNLLSSGLFRRDQVWFAEKNRYGATELFSLVEYKEQGEKKIRNDASYEKDYLRGRYGAVPIISDLGAAYGDR